MTAGIGTAETFKDLLGRAAVFLGENGVPDPEKEARFLASHLMGCKPSELFLRRSEVLDVERARAFEEMVLRRAAGEPSQYITGEQEFMGLTFIVTPHVLIPRPETETLVEEGTRCLSSFGSAVGALRVLDLCTGSGCIAVSMARLFPDARYYASDLSGAALDVARRNASAHGVEGRIEFLEGDLFSPLCGMGLEGSLDLVVSNPPYVSTREMGALQREIRDFEPRGALEGGEDGLDCIRRIIRAAPLYMKPGGALLIEIGRGQSGPVREILGETEGLELVGIINDLSGAERVVRARRTS